jgi:4-amino-4-deoxy-L-arabinose transferase-like glycosyltransferase
VLAAVYPELWLHDGTLLSESLSSLTTVLAVYATYRLLATGRPIFAIAAGAASGLAILTRAELALLLPLLVLPAAIVAPADDRRRRLLIGATATFSALALVTPWVVYNLSRFKEPVLISYGDGGTLLGANCDSTYSGALIGSWNGFCTTNRNLGDPSQANARARDQALRYMRAHMRRLPLVVGARVGRIANVFRPIDTTLAREGEARPRPAALAAVAGYWVLLAFAIAGVFVLRARHVRVWPLLAPVAIALIAAAAFYGRERFRAPAEPSLVVLAAIGIETVVVALAASRRATPTST